MNAAASTRRLTLECVVVFGALPALAWAAPRLLNSAQAGLGMWTFPAIWALGLWALFVLLRDPAFDRRELWNWPGALAHWRPMAIRFVLAAAALAGLTYALYPGLFFRFPTEAPQRWAVVMVGYPLLSVYLQEVAFRSAFMHRYRPILGSGSAMLVVSSLAFGWAHILMDSWLAVGLSVIGGWLYATTYQRSRSLALVSIEHALYGCWIFTVGVGYFFWGGRPAEMMG